MRRILRWVIGLTGAVLAIGVGLVLATRGDYPVPALVTGDPSLPALEIAGIRLHVRVVDGPPGAPTVIVLHGGPGGDFRSLQALAALSDSHRVVFYDQRGAGLSERVPAGALTLDGHLAELAALIDHVAPGGPVALIGHSWGAMLATAYLGAHPGRIDRAVLIEPGFLDAAGRDRWTEESRRYMSGPGFLGAAALTGVRAVHVDGPDRHARQDFLIGRMVRRFAGHPDNPYHCGHGYDAPGWRFGALSSETMGRAPASQIDRIAAGAAAFDGPVLLLAGACDDWLGAPLQSRHAARFADARLVVVPGAGHDVVWDNPEDALAAIRAFLAEAPPGPAQ
ncbi:alpha/beta fold hydrolase [Roseicyclus persicicus]|uniref:Alpha/beta hydrolase n=1 Tax=Roseicyclus persicicus TaxID=2650661 RepID=A0A7X6JYG9_9RHOB|nr:alpha/beta hydrolase [Roseibacterium persicicum]NKX44459.1 alpha/beta hydrolase [Roseibacterium persicicum]